MEGEARSARISHAITLESVGSVERSDRGRRVGHAEDQSQRRAFPSESLCRGGGRTLMMRLLAATAWLPEMVGRAQGRERRQLSFSSPAFFFLLGGAAWRAPDLVRQLSHGMGDARNLRLISLKLASQGKEMHTYKPEAEHRAEYPQVCLPARQPFSQPFLLPRPSGRAMDCQPTCPIEKSSQINRMCLGCRSAHLVL